MDMKPLCDVAVDETGLKWEQTGPLFDRYAVGLTGRIDQHWLDCYKRITVSAPTFTRFRLEPAASSVTFTCRSSDGPVEVMGVLKRLEELLLRVNQEVTAEAAARPSETNVAARPTAAPADGQAGTRPASTAAELLLRNTRH
ncbi:MAG: hypothetical protein ACRD00_03320 [Thermoanaerobaculia bacterium]